MSIDTISIIGLGLVGGSIAAACRRTETHVRAYDTNPEHLRWGLEHGIIDVACAELRDVVADADVVVVATPVSRIVATRYEVLVEHKLAAQGRELLAQLPGHSASQQTF